MNEEERNDGRFKPGNKAGEKYKREYCQMLEEFFAEPESEIMYERSYYNDGTVKSERPIVMPPKFPTFELFAASIGVVPNTLLNWCEKHKEFARSYEKAKALQLGIAKKGGMMKQYEPSFARYLLEIDHRLQAKKESEEGGKIEVTMPPEVEEDSL